VEKAEQRLIIDGVRAILTKKQVLSDEDDYLYLVLHQFNEWDTALKAQGEVSLFCQKWKMLLETILLSPEWFSFLFPSVVEKNSSDVSVLKTLQNSEFSPPHQHQEIKAGKALWLKEQSNLLIEDSLMSYLLAWLLNQELAPNPGFRYLSVYCTFVDALYGCFVRPEIRDIQSMVLRLHNHQYQNWDNSYCHGYAYQGYAKIGLRGIKPTELRVSKYEIDSFFTKDKTVLDIGSNAGFMAIHFSALCRHIDALEYNPYLCLVGRSVADELSVSNVSFIANDFYEFVPNKHYDIIFSLANHATIDHNLSINFEEYIAKIYGLLNEGGILFFESHNVYGPGLGGPGDDGDLNDKFDIAERYFIVEKYKMTRRFVEKDDIDKIFIILRKRSYYKADAVRAFELEVAIKQYEYSDI